MIQVQNAIERYGKIILTEMQDANIRCWIAGGALRDYFAGVRVKTDYDLFFPNQVEYDKCKAHFITNDCVVKWESDNGMKVSYKGKTFDLVKKFFAGPRETIDAFDFTVCMIAVDTEGLYYGESTFLDLAKRQLMVNQITYPASTMSRAFKYYKKGFSMCLGEMKKIVEAIQAMPKPEPEEGEAEEDSTSSGDAFFSGID